ncbi:MAG: tRNA lysidine(34) synthetase TilS [Deltaproteobacteria bacterium]|nr:tRNA lysidine(34) synthetase TilS [Deltaproteobacteria bacterium]
MATSLETKLLQANDQHGLWRPGERVLVAVSGGPDSMALLHLLSELRHEVSLHLEVAHLEHGIRGDAAKNDARFVEEVARDLQLPCHLKEIDLPRLKSAAGKGNLEALARAARYRFFAEVMQRQGLAKVATAHTLDDQAETVLMWFLRGAGMKGLAGIVPRLEVEVGPDAKTTKKITVVRPLLAISKAELLDYLASKNSAYRVDATNADTAYLRNWLRLELLPTLRARLDERLPRRLSQQAGLLREEDAFLDELARVKLDGLRHGEALDRERLLREPLVLQRRIVRLWLCELRGKLSGLDYDHLAAILRLARGEAPQGRLALPGGRELICEYGRLKLRDTRRGRAGSCYTYVLTVGKTLHIPEASLEIVSECSAAANSPLPESLTQAIFDVAFLTGPLMVRNFRNGDSFQPLGMTGHKKVKDLFIDAKLPLGTRAVLPLLTMGEQVLWIPGHGRSELGKVTARTQAVVRFKTVRVPV